MVLQIKLDSKFESIADSWTFAISANITKKLPYFLSR
jgi:hypothetical protein